MSEEKKPTKSKSKSKKAAAKPKAEKKSAPKATPKPAPVVEEAVVAAAAPKPAGKKVKVRALINDRCQYGALKFRFQAGDEVTTTPEAAAWLVSTKRAV